MAGRRRDPALDASILSAATELLHERGWGGFTVEEVAVRVGVPKSTVYKRWPSRVHLTSAILDNWLGGMIAQVGMILTAATEDRLRLLIECQTAFTSGAEGRAITEVLVSDIDEPVVVELHKRAAEYRDACHCVVGSVAATLGTHALVDVNLVADMLLGAIWLRSLRGVAIESGTIDGLHASVLRLLQP
jgi:AcrR family transcriptional regulator